MKFRPSFATPRADLLVLGHVFLAPCVPAPFATRIHQNGVYIDGMSWEVDSQHTHPAYIPVWFSPLADCLP